MRHTPNHMNLLHKLMLGIFWFFVILGHTIACFFAFIAAIITPSQPKERARKIAERYEAHQREMREYEQSQLDKPDKT